MARRLRGASPTRHRRAHRANPTTSLHADVATANDAIEVVGARSYSSPLYGGVVVTEAGTDENVLGIVYIAGRP